MSFYSKKKLLLYSKEKILIFVISLYLINSYNSLYKNAGKITHLNSENFEELVLKNNDPWFIHLYASWSGNCKVFSQYFKAAALDLDGVANFGVADGYANNDLFEKYASPGYPTFLFFGKDKKIKPIRYDGERSTNGFSEFVIAQIKNEISNFHINEAIYLNEGNFEEMVNNLKNFWVVMFSAKWSEQSKKILPEFKKAAPILSYLSQGKVKLAVLDISLKKSVIAKKYKVQAFPTIKIFSYEAISNYIGSKEAENMVFSIMKQLNEQFLSVKGKYRYNQIIEASEFGEKCGKGRYEIECILMFIDNIIISNESEQVKVLNEIIEGDYTHQYLLHENQYKKDTKDIKESANYNSLNANSAYNNSIDNLSSSINSNNNTKSNQYTFRELKFLFIVKDDEYLFEEAFNMKINSPTIIITSYNATKLYNNSQKSKFELSYEILESFYDVENNKKEIQSIFNGKQLDNTLLIKKVELNKKESIKHIQIEIDQLNRRIKKIKDNLYDIDVKNNKQSDL